MKHTLVNKNTVHIQMDVHSNPFFKRKIVKKYSQVALLCLVQCLDGSGIYLA